MPMQIKLFMSILLICNVCRSTSARETEILDQDGSSIETVAQAVCDITRGTDRQISQFSTIVRLVQFFHSLEPDHHLAACGQQSLPALKQMQLILSTDDICGEDKIRMIEKFHRNFISNVRKYRKEQKASNLTVPRLIKLFYLHYVSAVSATCERVATQDLKTISVDKSSASEEADQKLNQVAALFGKIDPAQGYKDMFVLWNFVDTLPLEKDAKLSRYLHQGSTRLVLQMHSAEPLTKMQDGCLKIKEFYSHSLLPVIRLADLGFYPESEQLVHMLSSHPSYSYMYTVTQLCETFLGLKVVQNESLQDNQIVVLSKEDTASLDLGEDIHDHPISSSVDVGSEFLKSVEDDNSQAHVKLIEVDVDSRSSEKNKILRRLMRRFKGELKHKGQFVLSNGSTKEDLGSILQESSSNIETGLVGYDSRRDEDIIIRRKRGVMRYVKNALKAVALCFIAIGWLVAWLVLFLIKAIVYIPTFFLHDLLRGFGFNNLKLAPTVIDAMGFLRLPPIPKELRTFH